MSEFQLVRYDQLLLTNLSVNFFHRISNTRSSHSESGFLCFSISSDSLTNILCGKVIVIFG